MADEQRERVKACIESAHTYAGQVEDGERLREQPELGVLLIGIAIAEALLLIADTIEDVNISQMERGR